MQNTNSKYDKQIIEQWATQTLNELYEDPNLKLEENAKKQFLELLLTGKTTWVLPNINKQ